MLNPVSSALPAPNEAARKVIVADEIRVGPLVITTTPDGGAGLWIGDTSGTMIALFRCSEQTGIGLYPTGAKGPCAIALCVDKDGSGVIQFARGDEVVFLTFDQVNQLVKKGDDPCTQP